MALSANKGEHDKHRGQQGGHQAHHSDLGVDGGTGGILEGVAHRVADDGSLVGIAALAALRRRPLCTSWQLSHRPPALDMNRAISRPLTILPSRKPPMAGGAADKAHDHRGDDGHQTGGNQLPESAGSGDVDALVVFGLDAGLALPQAVDCIGTGGGFPPPCAGRSCPRPGSAWRRTPRESPRRPACRRTPWDS